MISTDLKNLHELAPMMFRSAIVTPDNFHALEELGIKSVVSMKTDIVDTALERHLCEKRGIYFHSIPILILDVSPHTQAKFYEVEHLMDTLPKPLLVHCTHGSDRTGVAVAMYQMLHLGYSYQEAIEEMEIFGFNPLFSFWKLFLKDLYKSLKAKDL